VTEGKSIRQKKSELLNRICAHADALQHDPAAE
jgi:hypothetical protein